MATRIGVFGAGIGKFAIEAVLGLADEDVELAVVCDKDSSKWGVVEAAYRDVMAANPNLGLAAPIMGSVFRPNLEVALNYDLDGVIIALPTSMHSEVTIAALEAGIHTMVEKPMAHSLAAAEAMLGASRRHPDQIAMMVMNNLMRRHYQIIVEYLQSGRLGEIQNIEAWWARALGRPFRGSDFTNLAKSGGGPTVDLAVHLMYMVLYLLGWQRPSWVTGFTCADFTAPHRGEGNYGGGTLTPDAPIDVEDSGEAIFSFPMPSGRIIPVRFQVSWVKNIPSEQMGLAVYGTESSMLMRRIWGDNSGDDRLSHDVLTHFGHELTADVWSSYHREIDTNREPALNDIFMGRVPMAAHFVRCVQGKEKPTATLHQAYLTQVMLAGWLLSAESREPYRFPSPEDDE